MSETKEPYNTQPATPTYNPVKWGEMETDIIARVQAKYPTTWRDFAFNLFLAMHRDSDISPEYFDLKKWLNWAINDCSPDFKQD